MDTDSVSATDGRSLPPRPPRHTPLRAFTAFCKAFFLPIVALIAAAITCCFVPFDREYLGYFDLRTLACLFCTMAVVGAFKDVRFFLWLAERIVRAFRNMRNIVLALVFITFFGSMILANDMALITFLPLATIVFRCCEDKKYLAFTFIMQNIAANLGGMLTPFGNPQNLYLYSFYQIPTAEFFAIMATPFAVALVLILICCLFVRPMPVSVPQNPIPAPKPWRIACYAVLFAVSVLIVFRVFPYYWGALAVVVALIAFDRRAFLRVDYGLLVTFSAFFVFSGNLARIPAVRDAIGSLLALSPLFVGILSCQVMSNVPSAVLLSKFTSDYRNLLLAVNLGGLGTPIASLASLITLKEYSRADRGGTLRYLGLFLLLNFGFLAVLIGSAYAAEALFFG